ncbi:MAG: hypothetical protein ACTHOD_14815 [Motilibacteraceae bacterium]
MTAPTTRWRSVVPRPRSVGRHRSLPALLTGGSAALPNGGSAALPNGADEPGPQRAHPAERVPSMDGVGLGDVPGARVAGRYRLTRPVPTHPAQQRVQHPFSQPSGPSPAAPAEPDPASAVSGTLDPGDDRGDRDSRPAHRVTGRAATRQPVPGQLWLAQDEILGRPVLVRLLPADDPGAQSLLAAARRAARLVDQGALAVLDAAVGPLTPPDLDAASSPPAGPAEGAAGAHPAPDELPRVVYVIGEWVEAVDLATLLAQGPLPAREAARIAAEVARVLGHAHGEGLAHRQVVPEDVLLTETGRVALAGLGVEAALHGQDESATEEARRADLRAAGAVLYAGLTARWPLEPPHAGTSLPAAPREGLLPCSPRQVRAAVPTDLDELACRALGTARRGQLPVASADELADLLERAGSGRGAGNWTAAARGSAEWSEARWNDPWDGAWPDRDAPTEPDEHPTGTWPVAPEGRRTVGAAAAVVGTVLAAGVALLAWQVLAPVDAGPRVLAPNPGAVAAEDPGAVGAGEGPLPVVAARAFDPQGDGHEDDASAVLALDGDRGTAWTTQTYYGSPHLGGLKDGVGLVVDLGAVREVRTVGLDLLGRGTDLQVRAAVVPAGTAAGSSGPAAPPAQVDGFPVLLGEATDTGSSVAVRAPQPVSARYLLVWLTALPPVSPAPAGPAQPGSSIGSGSGSSRGSAGGRTAAFRGGVAEVRVSGPDPTAR